jgi:hypothetical protein
MLLLRSVLLLLVLAVWSALGSENLAKWVKIKWQINALRDAMKVGEGDPLSFVMKVLVLGAIYDAPPALDAFTHALTDPLYEGLAPFAKRVSEATLTLETALFQGMNHTNGVAYDHTHELWQCVSREVDVFVFAVRARELKRSERLRARIAIDGDTASPVM